MNMKKIVIGLLAALALSWASAVYAADNGTEFGIEDDLTVLGTGGTQADPDAEIKGFSVFGVAQSAPALNIPVAPGNIFVNGYVQVSSGMYVAGSSTFTAGLYSTGISSFAAGPGSIYIKDGAAGQVLKKVAGGAMVWGNDDAGVSGTGTQYRIPMWNSDTTLANSVMNQDGGLNSITLLASSMTIQGTGGDGLGVTGAVKLGGAVSILGANTFTVGTGLTTLGGALNVTGVSTLTDALTVHNYAQFGSGVTKSTFTTGGNLNMTSNGDIVLLGANAQITLPNAPVDGTDAANKNYVDTSPNAGPWDKSGINVRLDTITDIVGVGIDSPLAKLHVSSNNAAAADYLFIVSSGPLAANNRLTIKVDGQTNLSGTLGVTGDVDLDAKLNVDGTSTFVSSVTAKSGMGIAGTLGVTGDVDLDAKLNVDGTSTFVSSVTAKSNMGIAGTLGVTGAAALSDNLTVNGNTTLGNAATDWIVAKSSTTIDIAGGAVDNTSALTVKGTDSSGIYAAKFYSGANLAAWIKKK